MLVSELIGWHQVCISQAQSGKAQRLHAEIGLCWKQEINKILVARLNKQVESF